MKCKQILVSVILVASAAIQVSSNVIKSIYTKGPEYSHYIYPDHFDLARGDTLRFSVRTPSDAHILLVSALQEGSDVFEIGLGVRNNTINIIKDSKDSNDTEEKAVVRTVNLLSPREFRNFWIKIKDEYDQKKSNVLQVGIGTEDTPFLEWRYHYRTFPSVVSFRSDSWAEWRYGYIDDTYAEALYTGGERFRITTTRSYPGQYGQYLPLSEVVSHSNDAVTLYFSLWSNDQFRIRFSPQVGWGNYALEFGVKNDSVYISQVNGGAARYEPALVKDALGIEDEIVQYWIKLTTNPFFGCTIPISHPSSLLVLASHVDILRNLSPGALELSGAVWGRLTKLFRGHRTAATAVCVAYHLSRLVLARWKEAKNQGLPLGAVRGGYNERDELFVCRAKHFGHVLPGSFVPDDEETGTCHVSVDIDVIRKTSFEVLTGCRFDWIPASLGEIPEHAIPAGKNITGEIVYAVRVTHGGRVIIGKLHSGQRIAYIAFDNMEVLPFTNYEVLVKGDYATA